MSRKNIIGTKNKIEKKKHGRETIWKRKQFFNYSHGFSTFSSAFLNLKKHRV